MNRTADARFGGAGLADPYVIREALLAERRAYDVMRELVPDLALPQARRQPLDERQQAAVDSYQVARAHWESLRNTRRSPWPLLVSQSA